MLINKKILLITFIVNVLFVTYSLSGRKIVVPHDFPTIHTALGEAEEGDTVYVVNGRYVENIALTDNVVLLGQDKVKTIIDGSRKGPCVIGADGAVISNFTITNGTTGILCKNTRPIIENCILLDNKGTGVHALISLPEIKNNVFYRNEWTGIFLESVRGTRTSINHNVLVENGYSGIFCAHRTEVLIRNNIFHKNKQYGAYVGPEAKRTRLIFNDFHDNRIPYNDYAVINQTNISKAPHFIDPGYPEFNYFVKESSSCKGTGENGTDIGLITEEMVVALSTDRDHDGLLDDIDQCPDVAEDNDGYEDEDGCPDYDNDGDGIPDNEDQCPEDPEDIDGFQDEDGCPDPDNDKDGIFDKDDNCPNNPETVNGYKDQDGCPDEKPQEIKQSFILHGVNFKTASAELLEESYYVLEKVFNSLEAYPHVKVKIAGHTDSQGSDDYNLALSYDRAKAVMNYLVLRGISPDRLIARGYGETLPIADNDTEEGRYKNRRVEIIPIK